MGGRSNRTASGRSGEDVICPPRDSREIAGLIPGPGARLVGVSGQAHQPFHEDPAAFDETVLRFWATLEGREEM